MAWCNHSWWIELTLFVANTLFTALSRKKNILLRFSGWQEFGLNAQITHAQIDVESLSSGL
jgi:hypothetical protein